MKRMLTLTLIVCLVLAAGEAFAKEVTMQGQFETTWSWLDNINFMDMDGDNTSEDDFSGDQRIRQYFNYVDSENLSGTVAFEMNTDWGDPADGGQLATDGNSVRLKRGYIDFNWPDTSLHIRSGLQGLTWPSASVHSPIWNDDVAGIVASYAVNDSVSVIGGWARLYDASGNGSDGSDGLNDEIDAFTLIVPITMDGWSLTPYAIYALHGQNATSDAAKAGLQGTNGSALQDDLDIWWLGGAFTLSAFDPINIYADLIYGAVDGGSNGTRNDREGWLFSAKATYSMDMVTPGLYFAYTTGEDDDPNNGSEAFPSLGGSFDPTSFGFDGSALWKGQDNVLYNEIPTAMIVGVELADFSFLDSLSHTFRVNYAVGTSDSELTKKWGGNLNPNRGMAKGIIFTDDDSYWEVNFDSKYTLYEAMSAFIEIGYIDLDLDDDAHPDIDTGKMEAAWKLAVGLKYNY